MKHRSFRFLLSSQDESALPECVCAYWGSFYFLIERESSFSLLAPPTHLESVIRQALAARLQHQGLKWAGNFGRQWVEIQPMGLYLMRDQGGGSKKLRVGVHCDTSPSLWLSALLDVNEPGAVVSRLGGTYLSGSPWETVQEVLEEVQGEVSILLDATSRSKWTAIATQCERFIDAKYLGEPSVKKYLQDLPEDFSTAWLKVLKKRKVAP